MNPVTITPDLLRSMPIHRPDGADKHERGVVLVIGGCAQQPGGAMLAAIAALRGGAGKVRIATSRSVAPHVATAFPEARVYALDESVDGSIDPDGIDAIEAPVTEANAILIGPGMVDPELAAKLASALIRRIDQQVVIVDAAALKALADDPTALHHLRGRCVVTPHRREMSYLLKISEDEVNAEPVQIAQRCADSLAAVTILKGAQTFIAAPEPSAYVGHVFPVLDQSSPHPVYRNIAGNDGLATSGSGDVLSGLLAALTARGVDPATAAAWAVHTHAVAGDRLNERIGVGFLAREIADELPRALSTLLAERGSRGQ